MSSRVTVKHVLVLAFLSLGVASVWWNYHGAEAKLNGNSEPAVAISAVRAVQANALAETVPARPAVPAQTASASVRQLHPAPASIQRVLPSVTEAVRDWREFRPERIAVAPVEGIPLTFERAELREEGRYVTWVGRNPKLPGATFVGVATSAGYDAFLALPGVGEFSYHIRDDKVVTRDARFGDVSCGSDPAQPPMPIANLSEDEVKELITAVTTTSQSGLAMDIAAATEPVYVDVLMAYTEKALNSTREIAGSPDPVGYLDGQAKARLESANQMLINSQVTNFRWRYLGLVPTPPFTQTSKTIDALEALGPNGSLASWVKDIRYKRGADQLILLLGGDLDFSGQAYANKQKAVGPAYGLSVMGWNSSPLTIAHELAHNFGCQHNRGNAGSDGGPVQDNDGYWCYGHTWEFVFPSASYTTKRETGGTIMSYVSWKVPHFSNPAITVVTNTDLYGFGWYSNPLPLGNYQIGLPESDPRAANNARVLREQAATVSAFMESVTEPTIVAQPQGGNIARGGTLTLSVTANGGGLGFQWAKNGVEIAGATAAIYMKLATDTDSGRYTVVVSNYAGSVTSDAASIAVTGSSSGVSSGNGSSGGGGGGAPSFWFLGLLVLVAAMRRIWSERSVRGL